MDIGIYARPDYYFGYDDPVMRALMAGARRDRRPGASRRRSCRRRRSGSPSDYVNVFLFQLAKTGVADARIQRAVGELADPGQRHDGGLLGGVTSSAAAVIGRRGRRRRAGNQVFVASLSATTAVKNSTVSEPNFPLASRLAGKAIDGDVFQGCPLFLFRRIQLLGKRGLLPVGLPSPNTDDGFLVREYPVPAPLPTDRTSSESSNSTNPVVP